MLSYNRIALPAFAACLLSVSQLLVSQAHAERIPVGAGAYIRGLPADGLGPSNRNNQPAVPRVTAGLSAPHATNTWWSSLIWQFHPENPYSENMHAHPLAFRTLAGGLGLGYPVDYYVTDEITVPKGQRLREYHFPYVHDMTVGLAGLAVPETRVAAYSDWMVTIAWDGTGQSLRGTIGHGFPYAYFTRTGNSDALITANHGITVWSNQGPTVGFTLNGKHYAAFAPQGATWIQSGNSLRSTLAGRDYFSVAVLPDNAPATLAFFAARAHAHPVDTRTEWSYDETTAVLSTVFTVETQPKESGGINETLQALYRHQWLHTTDVLTHHRYDSARGEMRVRAGNQFTTHRTFHGVLPTLPSLAQEGLTGYSRDVLYNHIDELYRQPYWQRWQDSAGMDTYWTGKAMSRLALLLPLAEEVGHLEARNLFLAEIRDRLNAWYDGIPPRAFHYDPVWGTLIGYPAGFGSDTQLNDHHFHYAYYISASAYVAQYDPAWANAYGPMVEMLIRDANSPHRDDPMFPFLRGFDTYAGHNWANGSALFAAGNNQESSSEGMNFSASLILWGAVTGNEEIRDLGIFLYTTEASAIREYWFDVDEAVYPPEYDRPTLGILWGDGASYAIWWDGYIEELHGINFLPVTPASLYLGHHPDYLRRNQDYMLGNAGGNDVWKDVHAKVTALYDPARALQSLSGGYTPEWGESRAHTYHWIHTLNALGRVDTSVTANTPHYAVFLKNGQRTYAAWNPGQTHREAVFSDGYTLAVPARSLIWGTAEGVGGGHTPPPPPPVEDPAPDPVDPVDPDPEPVDPDPEEPETGDFSHALAHENGTVSLQFLSTWDARYVDVHYRLGEGGQQNFRMDQEGRLWTRQVNGAVTGQSLTYWFTYEQGGPQFGSPVYTTVIPALSGGVIPDPGPAPDPVDPDPEPVDPDPEEPETGDFSHALAHENGTVSLQFLSTWDARYVDVHYRLGGGGQQNFRMDQEGRLWTSRVNGAVAGQTLTYWFTYEQGGPQFGSPVYMAVIPALGGGGSVTPAPEPPPPAPEPSVPQAPASEVTQGPGTLRVDVATAVPAAFVDIHYRVNQGGRLSHRMQGGATAWHWTVANLQAGDVVTWYLTYEQAGLATDSAPVDTVVEQGPSTGGNGSPSDDAYTVGKTTQADGSVTFSFTTTWDADFVDVHYLVPNLSQQNFRMAREGRTWTHTTAGHQPTEYWFTYERGGLAQGTR